MEGEFYMEAVSGLSEERKRDIEAVKARLECIESAATRDNNMFLTTAMLGSFYNPNVGMPCMGCTLGGGFGLFG